MRKLIGIFGFIYVISVIVLVPMLIRIIWTVAFPPDYLDRTLALSGALKIIAWLVGGILILKTLQKSITSRLNAQIRSVAPANFKPGFELIGDYLTEYIAIAPRVNILVVVDLKQGIAHCGPISFLQGWSIEERGTRTTLVLRFNDFRISSIKFDIPRKRSDDIAAKLNHAMQF